MNQKVVLLTVPGLREKDVQQMPKLRQLTAGGEIANLKPSFPCVTCPVQTAMTTGRLPADHGVVANGFYWREQQRVEMWTAPNSCIEQPQIWDLLHRQTPPQTSAVWFPLHSKECGADWVCTPAPIHNPDGSESLWCYTRPTEMYGTLRDALGHFPLHHFWGPIANIKSTAWIVDSAIQSAKAQCPDFFIIYLPHLDYSAQRNGPDSEAAQKAVLELDEQIGRLAEEFGAIYDEKPFWLIAGEYAITPVDHVCYPNRVLREAGLLEVRTEEDGEHLDLQASRSWAMVDHQFAHVFVNDVDQATIARVANLFAKEEGIAEVLTGEQLTQYGLNHERSGEVVLISTPNSWQAYYWWLSDEQAPQFARTVDIHRKPGYDPIELHIDLPSKSIPLDASLNCGSHGAPAHDENQHSVLVASQPGFLPGVCVSDTDVFHVVMQQFGIKPPW